MAKILVVDDAAIDRALAGAFVQENGWQAEFAVDGEDAVRKLGAALPDAVLTDMQMPGMDGLKLVEHIRTQYPHVPVVLMTSYGSEEIAGKALRAGAASFVPKHSMAKDLLTVLQDVLTAAGDRQSTSGTASGVRPAPCGLSDTADGDTLDRDLQDSSYELGYESNGIATLVARLQSNLQTAGFEDEADLIRIGTALGEALNNAVDHGNLELDSELREEAEDEYFEMRRARMQQAPYNERRIQIMQRLTPDEAIFVIRDEGNGFDPDQLPDPTDPANLMRIGGRGMLLIRTFMDEVKFNAKGNEITLVKRRSSAS